MAKTPSPQAVADCGRSPVAFQAAVLKRKLWRKQRDIARAVATCRSTAVKGCHASGKTFVTAGAVLHHLAVYPQGKAFTIAPTLRQVKLMWEEIETARARATIGFPPCSTTGLRITQERYGLGFSSSKGVNAQGFHGADVLIIADESPGIDADVWDAIEGVRAGGRVRLVKLGNPTVPSGPFFDDFTRGRAMTECITISAFDTPNLQNPATGNPFTIEELLELPEQYLEIAPEPHLVTRHWVKDKYLRWGPNNPRYRSRVLGEFPTQSDRAVFSLEWIERARREPSDEEKERARGCVIQVGVDVAGPGDDETTACARVNGIILARGAWSEADSRGKVLRWISDLHRFPYKIGAVLVDVIGVGHNFALHLADQGLPVFGFVAGARPVDVEKFVNLKAEAYFRLRDMLQDNYISHAEESGALDEECEAQLSSIEYRETSRGLILIEPKEEARKRGMSSPDRAEAEVMAFARIVPRERTITFSDPQYEISAV